MAKYRKRPVTIEAEQWFPGLDVPGVEPSGFPDAWCVDTVEGTMHVEPGDWIITGIRGEKYPCKPDIFAETYEEVNDG